MKKQLLAGFLRSCTFRLCTSFLLLIFLCCFSAIVNAQTLTISNTGQTGISGTNWSTAGTNPIVITATGTANINTSVITGYLNAGTSVVFDNTVGGIAINNNIAKTTGSGASLSFTSISFVKVAANVSITSTSGALDIILWADSDNSQGGTVRDFIFTDAGATFNSNGGKIVMAGGPDDGSNGGTSGDGIPDGFAWNGSNAATDGANLYGGLTLGPRAGTGTVVSLVSNGGDIILRGATSNSNTYPGITSQGSLKIESGTGKITMYGKSTTGHGIELTYAASPSIAISSASTSTPAIDLKGTTSVAVYSGFWTSNNANGNVLIQSTASTGGGVTIEGTSNNAQGIFLGVSGTNQISQVLSQAGTITLKGHSTAGTSLALYGDVHIGNRKDATAVQGITPAVTASAANILIQANGTYQFGNTLGKNTNINSTGSLTLEAYSTGYTGTLTWTGNAAFGSAFSSITLGESAENYSITVNNTLTAAGNITAYSNNFTLNNGVGLQSTGAGDININAKGSFGTAGITRRTISTVNGNINIYADSDANGGGQLDIDYLTLNPGSGNTTLRCETLNWVTTLNTDKPYINGTGKFTIEPSDVSFTTNFGTTWFVFDQDANGISGLTLGKSTNTSNITHQTTALNIAGPIAIYGGEVNLTANLTSSANGDIFIKANTNKNGGAALNGTASILKTAGTGTLTMQSAARLNSGTITASGTGVLNVILWSDFGNANNGGVTANSITTNGGHLWIGGSNTSGGSYTWSGLTVGNGPSVGSVSNNFNAIDFYGPVSTNGGDVLIWGGNGYSSGTSGIHNMAGGSSSINSGSGDITLIAKNIAGNDISITTTGKLSLLPDGGSYPAAITWNGAMSGSDFNASSTFDKLLIKNYSSLGGLTIGYYNGQISGGSPVVQTNSSNITVSAAIPVAGPITLYGTALTVNQNLSSSTNKDIRLFGNNLSVGASATLSSGGNLIIEPITASTTIGLTGGTGTLAVTATNFNTNFTDGFSEIRIGNSSAGNITFGSAITAKDNMRFTTSGNLLLNEILTLGNNHLKFVGNTIVPASNKYIKTNGIGKLRMDLANNAGKLFPVGADYYNPVTITNHIGSTDEFYATVSNGVFKDGSNGGTSVTFTPRIDVTWNIGNTTATTGAGNIDLDFGWKAANVVGALSSPRLIHYNGTEWIQQSGTPTFDLLNGTLSYAAYTGSLSPFGIAEADIILPVNWISFSGKKEGSGVLLEWITSSENNNAYFDVERSDNGVSFVSIGRVFASRSTDNKENGYHFTDNQFLSGNSYYRLKQVDVDGKSSFSSIIKIHIAGNHAFRLISEPGTQQIQLIIPSASTSELNVTIYDVSGRRVLLQQVTSGSVTINTASLMKGAIYVVKVMQGNRSLFIQRFVK
ncbi:MAG: T9SS type A sorting domain-containing protein [Chitinophagaceae bacterium]|nr:T9SS type A sorting domain-containing protein [Chitinophagaceae bacterium]